MKNKGTLSVVMCNFNHSLFIQEALQEILSQSFSPIEVIVIDDGSTDNSVQIIESIAEKNPTVKLYKNDHNKGLWYSCNKGTKIAKGEYIYWAAADDRVCPGFFEKSVRILNKNPQAGLSSALLKIIGEDGNDQMWAKTPVISSTECFLSADQVRKTLLMHGFWFTGHTAILRKDFFAKDFDIFDPELYQFADHLVYLTAATKHGACFIPEILGTWRTTLDGTGYAETHFISEQTKTNSALDKMVQIMSSKENALIIPRNFVKQYKYKIMFAIQSNHFNKIQNEMIDFMKTLRSLNKSQGLLDKFVYLIIDMLNVFKFYFLKSYLYYRRTQINLFSLIRKIVSYRKGLKIYKNSKSNYRSR
jgi:glycosyltransferase involved in cell wall biosynthesis